MTTPQDVERLSAYLDHQLSPAETTRLEARLKQEPELQATLADLQTTVRLLRDLPTLKPPRSFTLSSSQAAKLSQRQPIFMKLRLATAMATLAFAAVVGGDLLSISLSLGFRAAAPALQGAAEKVEATEATASLSVAQDSFAATEAPPMAEATFPGEESGQTNTPEAEFSAPAATQASTDERTLGYTATLTETPTAAPVSSSVGGESATLAPSGEVDTQLARDLPASPLPLIRYIEIGLALLTIFLATAAWLTHKG